MTLPQGPAWLEVDLGAVRRNIGAVQRLVGPRTDVFVVVKANGYGHGLVQIARAAQEAGAAGLGVALVDEGVRLRESGITAPILLMGSIPEAQASEAVHWQLTCALCDTGLARALSSAAVRQDREALVTIKLDTGMGRIGIAPGELESFVNEYAGLPGLCVTGVFSHLSSAEDPDPTFSRMQIDRFESARSALAARGKAGEAWRWHLANSAATVRFPESRFDAVRVGLLAYGYNPGEQRARFELEPAACWKARISFIKECAPGTPISYGGDYRTPGRVKVATLGLGYADGYPRSLSNLGEVLMDGRRARILGRICMDQMMVEMPAGTQAEIGDQVVLMGRVGSEVITAEEVAGRAGTILHELLARLGSRMPRVYHAESGLC